MPRDFDCLDEPLSKPVAAKRRPQLVRSMLRQGQHLAEIGPSIVLAVHMQLDGSNGIDLWSNPHTGLHMPGLVDDIAKIIHQRAAGITATMPAQAVSTLPRAVLMAQKTLDEEENGLGGSGEFRNEASRGGGH